MMDEADPVVNPDVQFHATSGSPGLPDAVGSMRRSAFPRHALPGGAGKCTAWFHPAPAQPAQPGKMAHAQGVCHLFLGSRARQVTTCGRQ